MNRTRLSLALFMMFLGAMPAPRAAAQQPAETRLAGKWSGMVDSDAGQMPIDVTLQVAEGRASGSIATGHGELIIKGGTYADGKWILPFSGHGMEGRMVATLAGETLSGRWENPGMAMGTFRLERSK